MEINHTNKFLTDNIAVEILNLIPDLILVKGPESRIVWANKAFQDYYGMNDDQLQGMIDSPINKPDYTLQYIKDDEYVFTSGKVLNVKAEPVTRHDGVVRYFNTIKSPMRDSSGTIVMTIGISRDVTEQQEVNKNLQESLDELTKTNNLMVNRELKMVELKKELQECKDNKQAQ